MRHLGITLFAAFFISGIVSPEARSQEFPRYELFGEFSYAETLNRHWYGWTISATKNFNHYWGISLDISRIQTKRTEYFMLRKFDTDESNYYFLAGPQFTNREFGKWALNAHFLFGAARNSVLYDIQDSQGTLLSGALDDFYSFVAKFGGGVNYNVKGPLTIRLIRASYLGTHLDGRWIEGGEVSFGLGLYLGKGARS